MGVVGPASADPALAEGSSLTVLKTVCDTISRIESSDGTPEPGLGKWSFAENADNLQVELDAARFSDGESLDAQSVISTLTRAASPGTGSPWAPLLAKLAGFEELRNGSAPSISGLTRSEDGSLRMRLTGPYSEITSTLSHPSLAPLSERAIADSETTMGSGEPACSGPFEVQPGAGEGDVRLKGRTGYRGPDPAMADAIVIKSFESEHLAFEAFTKGEVDIAPLPGNEVTKADRPGTKLSSADLTVTQLLFDVSKPEFADPRLRQALSLAFDRLAIIDAAFGDGRQPAGRWMSALNDVPIDSKCSSLIKKIADPEKAKQILDSAGIGPGIKVGIFFDRERTDQLVAQALQVQAKDALGIELELVPLDPPQFEASLAERKDSGAWLTSTNPPLPGGDFQLGSLFETTSPNNLSRFSNESFDKSVSAARATISSKERIAIYGQAEELVCEAMPAIPLWRGVKNWIHNANKVRFEGPEFDVSGELLLRHIYAG